MIVQHPSQQVHLNEEMWSWRDRLCRRPAKITALVSNGNEVGVAYRNSEFDAQRQRQWTKGFYRVYQTIEWSSRGGSAEIRATAVSLDEARRMLLNYSPPS